jgi:hypothetical protein
LFRHVLTRAEELSANGIAHAAREVDLPRGALPDGSGLHFSGSEGEARANERATSVIWQWVAREEREVVWPPSLSSHAIVRPAA